MRQLHKYGIYHNNVKRALFDNFLLQPGHEHYLQEYLIFCSSLSELHRLHKVIRAFEFTLQGGYTYGQLFNVHEDWYHFFKENAWLPGIPKSCDNRLGVDRSVVDNIMRYYNGDLETAIVNALQLDNR